MPNTHAGAAALLSTVLLLAATVGTAETVERPNIVLIMSDNQSSRLIGAYGNREIETPNIDRIAQTGVMFRNAFAASGVCSPTRASLMTGLMPSQTGVHVALPGQPDLDAWSAIEEFRNLPQTLADAGYDTALIGKYHLGRHEEPQLGFGHWVTFPAGHTTTFFDQEVIDNGETYVVDEHLTDYWTDKAIEYIDGRPSDKPFFLFLSYNGPYMLPPTVLMEPNNRYAPLYQANPPSMPHDPVHPYLEAWARGRGPSREMVDEGTTAWSAINALNNPVAMINTAAETTLVDEGVGRVLDAIESQGISRKTLVIYTSDQGARFGHNGLWGNTSWSFPFVVHGPNMEIPLVMKHPGRLPEGQIRNEFINQVDLFPTLLEYIGHCDTSVEHSPGRSFEGVLAGKHVLWENVAFFEFVTARVIRTERWKYEKQFMADERNTLYDLVNDPDEKENLIDDPRFSGVRNALDARLTEYFDKYSTPEYDLWHGGSAKAILLDKHYGRNDVFRDVFPDWKEPFTRNSKPYAGTSADPACSDQ